MDDDWIQLNFPIQLNHVCINEEFIIRGLQSRHGVFENGYGIHCVKEHCVLHSSTQTYINQWGFSVVQNKAIAQNVRSTQFTLYIFHLIDRHYQFMKGSIMNVDNWYLQHCTKSVNLLNTLFHVNRLCNSIFISIGTISLWIFFRFAR